MIKLTRPPPPLDEVEITRLTDEYILRGTTVWNREDLKQPLLAMSSGKCCYCETNTNEESKYMEVEHFLCKEHHPKKVIAWENLLPSCKRCNVKKGAFNAETEGDIIDPTIDDPRDHFRIINYRFRGTSEKGRLTIDIVDLNNNQRIVQKRFEAGNTIYTGLSELVDMIDEVDFDNSTPRTIKKIQSKMEQILIEAQSDKPYSATCATILLESEDFILSKNRLLTAGHWSAEMNRLELRAIEIHLRGEQL